MENKITKKENLVLNILNNNRPDLYGLEIIKLSNGILKRGTAYTILTRMEDQGLISSKKEDKVSPGQTTHRLKYSITNNGTRVFLEKKHLFDNGETGSWFPGTT